MKKNQTYNSLQKPDRMSLLFVISRNLYSSSSCFFCTILFNAASSARSDVRFYGVFAINQIEICFILRSFVTCSTLASLRASMRSRSTSSRSVTISRCSLAMLSLASRQVDTTCSSDFILLKTTGGLASQESQGTLPVGVPRTLCRSSRWGAQTTWPSGQTYTDGGSPSSVQCWHRKGASRSSTAEKKTGEGIFKKFKYFFSHLPSPSTACSSVRAVGRCAPGSARSATGPRSTPGRWTSGSGGSRGGRQSQGGT